MTRLRQELDAINDQRVIPLSMRDYRAKLALQSVQERYNAKVHEALKAGARGDHAAWHRLAAEAKAIRAKAAKGDAK